MEELGKKKYKRDEVLEILSAYKTEYESKLKEQRDRIVELMAENKKLSAELNDFKNRDNSISGAIVESKEKAVEIEKKAEQRHQLLVESLRVFVKKWKTYFDYVSEKYPLYGATKEAKTVFDKISEVINSNVENIVGVLDGVIPEKRSNKVFNPQEKIDDYIAATGDNGFNLDEVLNPGELVLGDLCKELGLIEDL